MDGAAGNLNSMRKTLHGQLEFPLVYRTEWQDGYGAQGWKLDVSVNDKEVIACTSYTGQKSQTSVLIHDLLDHLVSGFWLSGYHNEARATAMHGLRNGIEVRSSYEQMIEEILQNRNLGEPFQKFLPSRAVKAIPENCVSDAQKFDFLLKSLGPHELRARLMQGFLLAGISGIPVACEQWKKQGLVFERMSAIGRCLQRLQERGEALIAEAGANLATGSFQISNEACKLVLELGQDRVRKELSDFVE
jgi:hypothetical protein